MPERGLTSYAFTHKKGLDPHFDGQWHSVPTGTLLPFQDIWGAQSSNGQFQILAVASNTYTLGGQYLVSISNNSQVQVLDTIPGNVPLSSLWFVPDHKYYLVGDGVFEKDQTTNSSWMLDPIANQLGGFPFSVRGSGTNDVFVVGDRAAIAHFNGSTWRIFNELQNPSDRLLSVAVRGNKVVAVGMRHLSGTQSYAVIYSGHR